MLIERFVTITEESQGSARLISPAALSCGAEARVVGISTVTQRLVEIGMVPGASISVVGTGLVGEPLQICLSQGCVLPPPRKLIR